MAEIRQLRKALTAERVESERETEREFRRAGGEGRGVKGEIAEAKTKKYSKWEEKEAALVKSREVVDMTDDEGSGTRGRGGRGVGGASVDGASVGSDTREGRGSKARLGKEVEEEMDGERGEVAAGKVSGKNSQKLFL